MVGGGVIGHAVRPQDVVLGIVRRSGFVPPVRPGQAQPDGRGYLVTQFHAVLPADIRLVVGQRIYIAGKERHSDTGLQGPFGIIPEIFLFQRFHFRPHGLIGRLGGFFPVLLLAVKPGNRQVGYK